MIVTTTNIIRGFNCNIYMVKLAFNIGLAESRATD